MHRAITLLALACAALLAGGCGDASDESLGSGAGSRQRVGGLDPAQVGQLNDAVASYNGAAVGWQARTPACQRTTKRLLRLHAAPARLMRCHRTNVATVVQAVGSLQRVTAGLEGDWSPDCTQAVASMQGFLQRYAAAWRRVLADFTALSAGRMTRQLDTHVDTAHTMALDFGHRQLHDVHEACMTDADVKDGLAKAEDAARAASD
jgi:hypothetical protein